MQAQSVLEAIIHSRAVRVLKTIARRSCAATCSWGWALVAPATAQVLNYFWNGNKFATRCQSHTPQRQQIRLQAKLRCKQLFRLWHASRLLLCLGTHTQRQTQTHTHTHIWHKYSVIDLPLEYSKSFQLGRWQCQTLRERWLSKPLHCRAAAARWGAAPGLAADASVFCVSCWTCSWTATKQIETNNNALVDCLQR